MIVGMGCPPLRRRCWPSGGASLGGMTMFGGRRLARGRGILPRRGELLLETNDGAHLDDVLANGTRSKNRILVDHARCIITRRILSLDMRRAQCLPMQR